jgi:hypothetical protein
VLKTTDSILYNTPQQHKHTIMIHFVLLDASNGRLVAVCTTSICARVTLEKYLHDKFVDHDENVTIYLYRARPDEKCKDDMPTVLRFTKDGYKLQLSSTML